MLLTPDSKARFVGRQWEIAILQRELETAMAGRLRVAALTGEPGIGKTRLMAHLAEHAASEGIAVLQGGASDAEGMPPYLPFLEALGAYIKSTNSHILERHVGNGAAILATILPELSVQLGGTSGAYPLPPEQARLRLFEALGAFLHGIAATSGLLLLLDDLHWTDPSTLDLLVHVARRQSEARLLVVVGYRAAEARENTALLRALTELTRHRVLTRLTLGPLSRSELQSLMVASLPGGVDSSIVEALLAQSEGNPFFTEELLRSWLESSALEKRDGHWRLAPGVRRVLPSTILDTVQERLTRLPPSTVELIRVAAVIGRSFEVELLAHVVDRSAEEVEDDLTSALIAQLLLRRGGAYTFTHDTVRETADASVSDTRRRSIHARVGDALESMIDAEPSRHLAELAFHFCRARNVKKGVDYAIRAAQRAEESFAFVEAYALYQEALKLVVDEDERRGDILLQCAQAALNAGHEREARDLFELALRRYRRAGDRRSAGRAAHGLALARWRQGELHNASIAFDTALALLPDQAGADAVRVLVDMASVRNWMGSQPEGLAIAQRALRVATELGDDRLGAAASRGTGQLMAWGNDLEGGNRLLERALALAVSNDDPAEAAEICGVLANTCFAGFNLQESRRVTLMRMDFARRSQQPHQLRHVYTWLAELSVMQGNWHDAEALIGEAQAIVERLEDDEPRAALHRVRGLMAQYQERFDDAVRWYTDALAAIRNKGPQHLAWYLGHTALVELSHGNRTEASRLMLELEEALTQMPAGSLPTAPGLTDAVEWALQAGDLQRAQGPAELLKFFEGRMFFAPVDLTLARYEFAQGNRTRANTYLDRAERDARCTGLRPHLLAILLEQAKLASPPDTAFATSALEEALSLSESLGLDSRAELIRNELDHNVKLASRLALGRYPAGLSPREVEVLRLVAGGRSNREIAGELFVSEKTVENHLTSIFNKTTTSNRAGATAFAVRNGLA